MTDLKSFPTSIQELDTALADLTSRGAPIDVRQSMINEYKKSKQPKMGKFQGATGGLDVLQGKAPVGAMPTQGEAASTETLTDIAKPIGVQGMEQLTGKEFSAPPVKIDDGKPNLFERAAEGTKDAFQKQIAFAGETQEAYKRGDIGLGELAMETITEGFLAGTSPIAGLYEAAAPAIDFMAKTGQKGLDIATAPIQAGIKAVVGEDNIEQIQQNVDKSLNENVPKVKEWWNNLPDNAKRQLQLSAGTLDRLLDITGGGMAKKGATAAVPVVEEAVEMAGKKAIKVGEQALDYSKSLFKRPAASVDDLIKQADEALKGSAADIRKTAEAEAPKIGLREKWAGVRPDIKKRIQGKQDKLKEYFDIAHARNLDDTVATPLEYGARQVEKARDSLKTVLSDTGTDIGKFRNKIATVKVLADDINQVSKTFDDGLKNLNLELVNGEIKRIKGKVAGKVSDSEIKLLQSLREDISSVKQSPTVENLIDLRNSLDNRVNFAKQAKDASNVVDPIARSTRGTIKDVNLKTIGKEQGQLLSDYSDLISVLTDLNKYVDGRTGGEFLLKQVLSERGRIPRELMTKLKDYTGIDLMDDAMMAQLATEVIGNQAQKGLFRQEIAKAGLDATDILDMASGAPGAGMRATRTFLEKGKGLIAPVEETFLKAAK